MTTTSTSEAPSSRLLCGHVLDVLEGLPDRSVHCCVTSPPYWGLRDYGTEPVVWGGTPGCRHRWRDWTKAAANGAKGRNAGTTMNARSATRQPLAGAFCSECGAWRGSLGQEPTPELYVEHLVLVFREVRRVLRDDGTLWLNLGDSFAGSWGGYRAAGTWRPSRSSIPRRSYMERSFLPPTARSTLPARNLVGIPWRVALALQADGWILRSDIVWHKPNCMPESATTRPTRSHEYVFLLAKRPRYYYDQAAIAEPLAESTYRRISQRTFARQRGGEKDYGKVSDGGNASRSARKALENLRRRMARTTGSGQELPGEMAAIPMRRNRRSVWTIPTKPFRGKHFAAFPLDLVRPCVLAGTPVEGTVLDPFAGSGTTGMVCRQESRGFVGIDLSREYVRIAEARIGGAGANLARSADVAQQVRGSSRMCPPARAS